MDNNTTLRDFSLMLDALAELQPEIAASQSRPCPAPPSLADSISQLGPLPKEALLLGLASDGLPVLLNLHDPRPGPLLVAADPGAGKTALLQSIARVTAEIHTPEEVQFGIISTYPDEWGQLEDLEHCVGLFPTYHDSVVDFLASLSGWAHANKGGEQAILLLIDDLESMNDLDFDTRQTLRWLLLRGPSRRVWPVVTLNPQRLPQVADWLDAFRTRLFGQVNDERAADILTRVPGTSLRNLQAGIQFTFREGQDWLRFWIPGANRAF